MTTITRSADYVVKLFKVYSPRELAPRLGTSEEVVRNFLRKYYPEIHERHKAWNITNAHWKYQTAWETVSRRFHRT